MVPLSAFLLPPGSHVVSGQISRRPLSHSTDRCPSNRHQISMSRGRRSPSEKLPWPKVLLLTAGTALTTTLPAMIRTPKQISSETLTPPEQTAPVDESATTHRSSGRTAIAPIANAIPLDALGIKREDFLSDRELRRRKTTQFSEAEQEIMELEEWEVDTQWFRDFQMMWASIASVGGMFVLYKGGVMWENWIKEQEKKDMEEEIELTGTFIDPRAVRKDDEDNKDTGPPKPPGDNGDKPGKGPTTGDADSADPDADFKQGDLESLEKLYGKS